MNQLVQLSLAVVRKYPYSLNFFDMRSKHIQSKIDRIIRRTEEQAIKIIEEYRAGKIVPLPGKDKEETAEIRLLEVLNRGRNEVGDIIEQESKVENNLMNMIRSGTGGKILNLAQISGFVGQQALRGKRIIGGYDQRALPHFKKGDLSPEAHGFVKKSYKDGLKPIEYFFNCVVGRDSYIDTAVRTPKSGYLQRRLINALQDLKVNYDGTVRDSSQTIIQFSYGGDSIDVSKSDGGGIDINE